jgi:hypothetical protein
MKQDGTMLTGFIWLRIRAIVRQLWDRKRDFEFHLRKETSWLTE